MQRDGHDEANRLFATVRTLLQGKYFTTYNFPATVTTLEIIQSLEGFVPDRSIAYQLVYPPLLRNL